ncbi:putative amidohydrolase [Labrys miyagiensis]
MKLIAIEEHFLTSDVRRAWAEAPTVFGDDGASLHLGEMEDRLDDLGAGRIALMDEGGVDMQVLSLTTPGLHDLAPAASVDLACRTNELVAATVAGRPDRFQGFAALPTPAPERAALELDRSVRQLGLKGAMVCGRTGEMNLDHLAFRPIFETAAALRVPVFIHPQMPQRPVREVYYSGFGDAVDLAFSTYGLGWHYEAGIQFLRLALARVFDRLPDLQIILGHWGEVVLFYTERLDSLSRVAKLDRSISDYMRHNLYVTASGMFSPSYLQRAIEIVGADRILFSTDHPYQYKPGGRARAFLAQAPLNAQDKEKFAFANWERLTGAA